MRWGEVGEKVTELKEGELTQKEGLVLWARQALDILPFLEQDLRQYMLALSRSEEAQRPSDDLLEMLKHFEDQFREIRDILDALP